MRARSRAVPHHETIRVRWRENRAPHPFVCIRLSLRVAGAARCRRKLVLRTDYLTVTRTLSRPQLSSRVPRACSALPSFRLLEKTTVAAVSLCGTVKVK